MIMCFLFNVFISHAVLLVLFFGDFELFIVHLQLNIRYFFPARKSMLNERLSVYKVVNYAQKTPCLQRSSCCCIKIHIVLHSRCCISSLCMVNNSRNRIHLAGLIFIGINKLANSATRALLKSIFLTFITILL